MSNATNQETTDTTTPNGTTSNGSTNIKTDQTLDSLKEKLQQTTSLLQQKIEEGDCKAIKDQIKEVVKNGNSIMTMINAGRAKESDFSNAKSQLATAVENVKVKCKNSNAKTNNGSATNTPKNNAPKNNAPKNNPSANNAPATNAPKNNPSANNAPATNAPATNTPKNNAPKNTPTEPQQTGGKRKTRKQKRKARKSRRV